MVVDGVALSVVDVALYNAFITCFLYLLWFNDKFFFC